MVRDFIWPVTTLVISPHGLSKVKLLTRFHTSLAPVFLVLKYPYYLTHVFICIFLSSICRQLKSLHHASRLLSFVAVYVFSLIFECCLAVYVCNVERKAIIRSVLYAPVIFIFQWSRLGCIASMLVHYLHYDVVLECFVDHCCSS